MSLSKYKLLAVSALVAIPLSGFAQERADKFEFHNRLRAEYDDNVRQSKVNKDDSLKLIEEVELVVNFDELPGTYIGLRYNPSFVYWENRDEDDTDLHHQFDLTLTHDISPRVSISAKDIFRLSDQPELQQGGEGAVVRENNDFIYNSFNAGVTAQVVNDTVVAVDARHALVAYDENDVSRSNDFSLISLGLDLRHQLQPEMTVEGQARYTTTDYDDNLRGSDSVQIGGKLSRIFSPTVQGSLRAGFENTSYDTNIDDLSTPYVDGGVVLALSSSTRLNAGAGFGQAQTPTSKFASQERTTFYTGLTQDLSNRLTLNGNVSYSTGDFSRDNATSSFDPSTDSTGTEDVLRLAARVTYMINRSNWVEAGWQYVDLTSDIRPASEYDRNRLSVGWKTRL